MAWRTKNFDLIYDEWVRAERPSSDLELEVLGPFEAVKADPEACADDRQPSAIFAGVEICGAAMGRTSVWCSYSINPAEQVALGIWLGTPPPS